MKRLPRTTWSRGLCWLWGPTQIILGGRLHTRRRRDPVNTRLPAKPDRLGECAARCGIAGRDHGIIGGQIPFGAVFVRGEPETVHQVAFQRLRSEEHTSELQSLMRISYAVFCLKKKQKINRKNIEQR